jgi:carbon monoxide dehydrogenase subunit G
MSKIEKSIDVNVPVREAYNQWTQFESFPEFMEGVESVQQRGDTNLHWVAQIAGKRQEWDAEITEQTPDQRIAWTSTTGDRNAGAVDFHRVGDNQTRVTLTMDVEPSGVVEKVGDALGIPSGQVEGDLKRFKEFIESRGSATGAWRGEVDQNNVTGSTSGSSSDRELAGSGASMGSTGSSSDLGSDFGSGSGTGTSGSSMGGATGGLSGYDSGGDYATGNAANATDDYGSSRGTGTPTGSTGTGDMGSGLNDPQDLGTGRRENTDL